MNRCLWLCGGRDNGHPELPSMCTSQMALYEKDSGYEGAGMDSERACAKEKQITYQDPPSAKATYENRPVGGYSITLTYGPRELGSRAVYEPPQLVAGTGAGAQGCGDGTGLRVA